MVSVLELRSLQLLVQGVLADIERVMEAIEADQLWSARAAQAEPLRSRLIGCQAQFYERLELVRESRARRSVRLLDTADQDGWSQRYHELEPQHAAEMRFLPAALRLRDEATRQLAELRDLQGLPPLDGLESLLN